MLQGCFIFQEFQPSALQNHNEFPRNFIIHFDKPGKAPCNIS